MLRIADYREVIIEPGITFDGHHDGIGGIRLRDSSTQSGGLALLDFAVTRPRAERLDIRCNTRDAAAFSILHTADREAVKHVVIGGRHLNGGLRMNSGIKDLHFDDVLVTDPRGYGDRMGLGEEDAGLGPV